MQLCSHSIPSKRRESLMRVILCKCAANTRAATCQLIERLSRMDSAQHTRSAQCSWPFTHRSSPQLRTHGISATSLCTACSNTPNSLQMCIGSSSRLTWDCDLEPGFAMRRPGQMEREMDALRMKVSGAAGAFQQEARPCTDRASQHEDC